MGKTGGAKLHVEVSVAAHFVPARVEYLVAALYPILDWAVGTASIVLVTQDLALAEEPSVREWVEKAQARGFNVDFDKVHGLDHPWHLTWWHKEHLREWWKRPGGEEDLFLYIEDDICITNENLNYFRTTLPGLKSRGLIPGFIRYEWSQGRRMSTDFLGNDLVDGTRRVNVDGQDYINPRYPYWAGFMLDRELCAEYFQSDSSTLARAERKAQAHRHSCRVLSAWGLCYEKIPEGFSSRYVIPVDGYTPQIRAMAWHTAENYSKSKTHSFGTVAISDIFLPVTPSARMRRRLWQVRAYLRRISRKMEREWRALMLGRPRPTKPDLGKLDQMMRVQRQSEEMI